MTKYYSKFDKTTSYFATMKHKRVYYHIFTVNVESDSLILGTGPFANSP